MIESAQVPSPTQNQNEIARQTVVEALSDYFPADNLDVANLSGVTTVNAYSDEITAEVLAAKDSASAPDNWSELKDALCTTVAALPLLPNTSSAMLYLMESADGEIYLTIAGDTVLYDAMEARTESTYGPGYMTLEIFNKIQIGMTYEEVVNLVGTQGTVLSDVDVGDPSLRTTMYSWEGNGQLGANANVMTQGGKVVSKAQFGLE